MFSVHVNSNRRRLGVLPLASPQIAFDRPPSASALAGRFFDADCHQLLDGKISPDIVTSISLLSSTCFLASIAFYHPIFGLPL